METTSRFACKVETIFEGDVAFKPELLRTPPERLVLLCFTNRSGSNFLAGALSSTQPIHSFGECLLPEGLARHRRAAPSASFHAVFAKRIGDFGKCTGDSAAKRVAVVKVGYQQLAALAAWGYLDGYRDRLHFVHIQRTDVLGQAISHAIASTTKVWASYHEPSAATVTYDAEQIRRRCRTLAHANASFAAFFVERGIMPSHVVYEDLVADPAGVIARIGRDIGEPGLVYKAESVRVERQVDARKAEFRRRFLAETGGEDG